MHKRRRKSIISVGLGGAEAWDELGSLQPGKQVVELLVGRRVPRKRFKSTGC